MSIMTTSDITGLGGQLPTEPSSIMLRRVTKRVEQQLVNRFGQDLGEQTVRATVRDVYAELSAGARIKTYLPTLTERVAETRLRGMLEHDAVEAVAA